MAANTAPIFVATPRSSWIQTSTSAVTGTDGTDANVKTVFTAGANGSKIEMVFVRPSASNTDTVVRFWVNNGSSAGTATNNTLVYEADIATNTLSQTNGASSVIVWPANLVLPATYKLLVACGVATSAMNVTAIGGDY